MIRTSVTPEEYDRALAHLREGTRSVIVEADGRVCEVSPLGVLPVSPTPPTVAVAIPADSGPAWGAITSRVMSLQLGDGEARAAGRAVRLEGVVVRWLPGGSTHTVFLAEVTNVEVEPH